MTAPSERLKGTLDRAGYWLQMLPWWQFVSLSLIVFTLKSTFFWRGSFFFSEAAAFPKPASPFSSSVLAVVIHKASGSLASPVLFLTSSTALALATWLLYYFIRHESDGSESARRFILLAALSWPGVLAILPWMGNGTAFLALFVVVAVLARNWPARVAGIVGATFTHPEQAVAAFLMLGILSITADFARFRRIAFLGVLVAGLGAVIAALWIASEPVMSRGALLPVNLEFSMRFALRYGALGSYTWWGVWWLLVLVTLVLASRKTRWTLIVVGILIPGLLAIVTDNYTRVFAGVASGVGLAVFWYVVRQIFPKQSISARSSDPRFATRVLLVAALAFVLLPNLHFMMPGEGVPVPGAYWVGVVENYLEFGRP